MSNKSKFYNQAVRKVMAFCLILFSLKTSLKKSNYYKIFKIYGYTKKTRLFLPNPSFLQLQASWLRNFEMKGFEFFI